MCCYYEQECDMDPRPFHEPIYVHPDDYIALQSMGGVGGGIIDDVNVLTLIDSYNQALVCHHDEQNYSHAMQIYKLITDTIETSAAACPTTRTAVLVLSQLAMRAHNNMGHIFSIVQKQNRSSVDDYHYSHNAAARIEFEKAVAYGRRRRQEQQQCVVGNTAANIASHQLELATVLSNWCNTSGTPQQQQQQGLVVDDNNTAAILSALEDIVRIRSMYLKDSNHPDLAVAHYNLGRAELSLPHRHYRRNNTDQKAMKHFLQYMKIASHRWNRTNNNKTNNKTKDDTDDFELDPIRGLVYVLQIQQETKKKNKNNINVRDGAGEDDLMWGLRTLQDHFASSSFSTTTTDNNNAAEIASILNYIGTILFQRNDLEYALCFFAQELRVNERMLLRRNKAKSQKQQQQQPDDNNNDIDVSITVNCNNIGRILQELKRYEEAKYYYQRSLIGVPMNPKTGQFINKKMNEDDDTTASLMNLYSTICYNLGIIYDKTGSTDEAVRSFQMSLKVRRNMIALGHVHCSKDVSCLLYNIGVLQMEQKQLNDATRSFREALENRQGSTGSNNEGTNNDNNNSNNNNGHLDDHHLIETLQKLSSMHRSDGNLDGALETNRHLLSVLTTDWTNNPQRHKQHRRVRTSRKIAIVMKDVSELHQAQGNLLLALEYAQNSVNLFRSVRTLAANDNIGPSVMDDTGIVSLVEEETNALLLVGSLHHELCDPVRAQIAFSEIHRLIRSTVFSIGRTSALRQQHAAAVAAATTTLIPLLEISTMLATAHCAAEA